MTDDRKDERYALFFIPEGDGDIKPLRSNVLTREEICNEFARQVADIVQHWLGQIDESPDGVLVALDTPKFEVNVGVARLRHVDVEKVE